MERESLIQLPKLLLPPKRFYDLLSLVLHNLMFDPKYKTNKFWQSNIGLAKRNYLLFCIEGFYRLWKNLPPAIRSTSEEDEMLGQVVHLEAQFWLKIWRLVEEIEKHVFLKKVAELIFHTLVDEGKLMAFYPFLLEEKISSTKIIRNVQNQNRQLEDLTNPFDEAEFSLTSNFVELATKMASSDELFRKQFFSPMVKNRMELLTFLRSTDLKLLDESGNVVEWRGRPPKNKGKN